MNSHLYQGSIRKRLTLIIFFTSLITILFGYSGFLYWYMNQQYNQAISSAQTISKIIGQDVAKVILLNDINAAADISSELRSFSTLQSLVLYKKDHTPILQYSSKNEKLDSKELLPLSEDIVLEKNSLFLSTKALYENNHLGFVKINFKIETIWDIVKKDIDKLIAVTLLILVGSYFLSIFFAQRFTTPIVNLVEFLEEVEVNDLINKRIPSNEKNEFGKLYEEVNTLLSRIQSNQNDLKIASVAFETQSGMVITDKNTNILQANEAFSRITGYELDEVKGLTPAVLKSGQHDAKFYQEMYQSLEKYHYWSGEISNRHKDGHILNEHLLIQVVLDELGEVAYYVSSFLDITDQKRAEAQLKEKDNLLVQQSKMAAMGEMLENIAHQWRQPLSAISTAASGLVVQKELKLSTPEEEIAALNTIRESSQFLSHTIEDFKNYFKPDKSKHYFNLEEVMNQTLMLMKSKSHSMNIKIINNCDNLSIFGLENEFKQVILNLLSNATDALDSCSVDKRMIFINTQSTQLEVTLEILDNAGGIPENIIHRIFEPYFTTKHQQQGTGIGLYMSLEMVQKHMNGEIHARNKTFDFEGESYKGACFSIKLPLESE